MDWKSYIKNTRSRLGLSQSQFASILGVSPYAIQSWEIGRANPQPLHQDVLYRLNASLGEMELLAIEEAKREGRSQDNALRDFLVKIAIGTGAAYGLYQLLKLVFEGKEK